VAVAGTGVVPAVALAKTARAATTQTTTTTTTTPTTTTTTPTTPTGTTTTTTTPATPPVNNLRPFITGTAKVGDTVKVNPGKWTATPAPTFAYQWFLDHKLVSGVTGDTFKITADDAGQKLTVTVTATNSGGSKPVVSRPVTIANIATTPPVKKHHKSGGGNGSGSSTKHHKQSGSDSKHHKHSKSKRDHKKHKSAKNTTATGGHSSSTTIGGGFPVSGPGVPWGKGTVFENPFTNAQLAKFAQLAGDKVQPPSYLIPIYKAAAAKYQIPWEVLAAINYIETGYGKDLAVSSAGAVGWMQFMPSTWAKYGEVVSESELDPADTKADAKKQAKPQRPRVNPAAALSPMGLAREGQTAEDSDMQLQQALDAATLAAFEAEASPVDTKNGSQLRHQQALAAAQQLKDLFGSRASSVRTSEGEANPWNPDDAIFAAANYLTASGAHGSMANAVYSYNHANWYVQEVLTVAQKITINTINSRGTFKTAKARNALALRRLEAMRTEAYLLNGIAYVWGGGHSADNWLVNAGYDCSGFVSAVLHSGGYLSYPVTTQTLPGQPGIAKGPGKYVTIYDRTNAGIGDDHVIIDLGGEWWESGGGSGDGGAGEVHRIKDISPAYVQSFNTILHPDGM
jgi:Transglycosylase SLT domain